ncbi:MAG TPA: DUF1805 domain-containing protein [Pirellulaceae bacterium]|nr:DUF1805 domain-containing protein [Pirellulaceae bacterium]
MNTNLPIAQQRQLDTPHGPAIGASYRWNGGQYCAIHTAHGVVGCGIFDLGSADTFNMPFAIARGTPEKPLSVPEDLYDARIVGVSAAARKLGIAEGMTGLEAVGKMLSASS